MDPIAVAIFVLAGLLAASFVLIVLPRLVLWRRANRYGPPISLWALQGMMWRQSPVRAFIKVMRFAQENGLEIEWRQLESHLLCGGSIEKVVKGMAQAKAKGLELSWISACAIDFSGHDPRAAVENALRRGDTEVGLHHCETVD